MQTKITFVSGFLGSGKTTWLHKFLPSLSHSKKTAIIENEFGTIGLDSKLIQSDLTIKEINAGCICCSVAVDFRRAIASLVDDHEVEQIYIEPSGLAGLSELIRQCQSVQSVKGHEILIEKVITMVDALGFEDGIQCFGTFYKDQMQCADFIFLTHLETFSLSEIVDIVNQIKDINPLAVIVSRPVCQLDSSEILALMSTSHNTDQNHLYKGEQGIMSPDLTSFSLLLHKTYEKEELQNLLGQLRDASRGRVVRAKGIVRGRDDTMFLVQYTPYATSIETTDLKDKTHMTFIGQSMDERWIRSLLGEEVFVFA